MGKVLTLKYVKNNVDNQCIPVAMHVVLKNQFEKDKRTNLKKVTYKKLKNWVNWGAHLHKQRFKLASGREEKYYSELFKGNFNVDTFHLDLNQHIREINLKLEMTSGFRSKDIKEKIDEGKYPMLLIEPQYINAGQVKYNNPFKRNIRGEPSDFYHYIVIHGYDDENFGNVSKSLILCVRCVLV